MTIPASSWVVVCALAVAFSLAGERTGRFPWRAAGKTVASLSFVAYAWSLGVPSLSPHGPAVFAALVLGLIGDILLLGTAKRVFLSGLVAFLLSHVAYAAAFIQLGVSWPVTVAAALAMSGLAAVVWRWLGPHAGKMRNAVLAYIVVITAMVALSFGTAGAAEGRLGLVLAAVLFFSSDLAVARQRFVEPGFINRAIGLPLYYAAQCLFVWFASQV